MGPRPKLSRRRMHSLPLSVHQGRNRAPLSAGRLVEFLARQFEWVNGSLELVCKHCSALAFDWCY